MGRLSLLLTLGFALTLTATAAANAAPGDTLYIQSDNVNVYEAPSVDAPVLMQLDQGQKLKEFRRQGGWVKVIIYGEIGKDGWVEQSHLGSKPRADVTAENQEPEEDTIVGAIETPKPKAKSLLHNFLLRLTDRTARSTGGCRYITKSGATKRFKIGVFMNKTYKIKAKAIRCSILTSPALTLELWADGKLLGSSREWAKRWNRVKVNFSTPWIWTKLGANVSNAHLG